MEVSFHVTPNSVLGMEETGRYGAVYLSGSGLAGFATPAPSSLLFYWF